MATAFTNDRSRISVYTVHTININNSKKTDMENSERLGSLYDIEIRALDYFFRLKIFSAKAMNISPGRCRSGERAAICFISF